MPVRTWHLRVHHEAKTPAAPTRRMCHLGNRSEGFGSVSVTEAVLYDALFNSMIGKLYRSDIFPPKLVCEHFPGDQKLGRVFPVRRFHLHASR